MICAALVCVLSICPLATGTGRSESAADTVPVPERPARPVWLATAIYGQETFDSNLPAWSDWQQFGVALGRRFERGSLAAEGLRTRRFGLFDESAVLDGYLTLWRRAYGNLRVQATPGAHVLPSTDVGAEVFQGLGAGLEASLGARRMQFDEETVAIYAATVGRFAGDWFVRGRVSTVPRRGSSTVSGSALVRRYLGTPTELIEASAGAGEEAVTVGAGQQVEVRRTTFVSARAQKFVTARLGFSASLSADSFKGVPARRGAAVGVMVRWW